MYRPKIEIWEKEEVWSERWENENEDLGADQTTIEQRPIASDEMKIWKYKVQNFETVENEYKVSVIEKV